MVENTCDQHLANKLFSPWIKAVITDVISTLLFFAVLHQRIP